MRVTGHRPISTLAACAAALLLFALSACMPGNENSVIDRPLANEDRMLGLWAGRLGDDDIVVVRIAAESPEVLRVDIGVYAEDAGIARYRASRTRIGDRDILELTETDASSRAGAGAKMDMARRFFVAYVFDGDKRFSVYLQNELETPLEKAVEQGRLPGRSEDRDGNKRILVTAPTDILRDFIAETANVFGNPPVVLTKMPPVGK